MRIIDKNTDFYDYLQNVYRDDSITFDRTDSFILTKEDMCRHLRSFWNNKLDNYVGEFKFVLLQVCNTFWLFLIEITDVYNFSSPKNFSAELLTTWKNYSRQRALIRLGIIHFSYGVIRQWSPSHYKWKLGDRTKREDILKRTPTLVNAIDTNDYNIDCSIDKCIVRYGGENSVEKHLPLLKASGLAGCIDPLEIYLAFEEYFSLEKTASERTTSIGITDKEKIENHGFDVKTSFRGKG